MTLDLKITGATVFDGTGGDRYCADIGIAGGRVVEIGSIAATAHREIAADGAIVTPGFIDMHTHYDAQAFWDDDLIASARNGVTSAVMGNCGVGCAPLSPTIRDDVISLLEGVEDIPRSAIEAALDWKWDSFGSYLDRLAERRRTINLAANAAHAPMRMIAMGAKAFDGSAAGPDEIAAMRGMLAEALDAGAVAFSTDRIGLHQMGDGRQVPDFHAAASEVMALAEVVAARPGCPIQFASDFGMIETEAETVRELALLRDVAALGIPVYAPLQQYPCEGGWQRLAREVAVMNAAGANIVFEACARAIGVLMGLEALVHPFSRHPSYMAIAQMPLADRVAVMRRPDFRARLLAEQPAFGEGDARVRRRFEQMYRDSDRIFIVEDASCYEANPATSVRAIADRERRSLEDVFYDALMGQEGRQFLYMPIANFADGRLDEQRAILSLPNALVSFGDAGAHLAQICDAAYSSFVLAHWGRDREHGLQLERLVQQMTSAQADLFGFAGRGRIALGAIADLNVIDHASLQLDAPRMLHDLPGGASRLMQTASGYLATLVGGVTIVERDELTGSRPGTVLRRSL